MSKQPSYVNKHLSHNATVVFTPGKIHYAKLCCVDCGNLFLQWLGPDDLVAIGQIDEKQKQELIKSKKPKIEKLQKQGKYKSKQSWSNASEQERNFYKSYQPKAFTRGSTPTQLIGDRLALASYSKYNGNSIHLIPTQYLESLMAQNKIGNSDDRKFIMASIKLRSGANLGSPEYKYNKA